MGSGQLPPPVVASMTAMASVSQGGASAVAAAGLPGQGVGADAGVSRGGIGLRTGTTLVTQSTADPVLSEEGNGQLI